MREMGEREREKERERLMMMGEGEGYVLLCVSLVRKDWGGEQDKNIVCKIVPLGKRKPSFCLARAGGGAGGVERKRTRKREREKER